MKKILIIRQQNNQLGDLICTIPFYATIKKKFPKSKITLITATTNYPIPIKEINPYIDNILVFHKKNFFDYVSFLYKLRDIFYDYCIIPSTLKISNTSYIIGFFSKAGVKIGVERIDNDNNRFDFFLNLKKGYDWNKEKIHQIIRIMDIASSAGFNPDYNNVKQFSLSLKNIYTENGYKWLKDKFNNKGITIGIHPGAGKTTNIWGADKYYELIKLLYTEYNCNIVITSGIIDDEQTNLLMKNLLSDNIPFQVAKNLEILLLGGILKNLDLFITNDTGIMHYAAYLGTKTISLFGPTNSFEWAPLKDKCISIQSESKNIRDINSETVFSAAKELIG